MGSMLKDVFKELFFRHAAFFHCKVLTYACLDRYYMALIKVHEPRVISDDDVIKAVKDYYSAEQFALLQMKWAVWKRKGKEAQIRADIERFRQRVYKLPEFMKAFNQNFPRAYNKICQRNGSIWNGRYQCTCVEDSTHAKSVVAAYIDLAPVRDSLVSDPQTYRWSGYGDACAGHRPAQNTLAALFSDGTASPAWPAVNREYMKLLSLEGSDLDVIAQKINNKQTLLLNEALRCNVKYFESGYALGSEEFINKFLQNNNHLFLKDAKKAKPLLFAEWGNLYTTSNPRTPQIQIL
jgi:hypothetical protein